MLVAQGKLDEALKSYRDSLAIAESLAAADRSNAGGSAISRCPTKGSATCWWRRASSTRRSRAYRDSLAIRERLAASDRSNTGWQRDLSVSYNRVGDVLVAQGKLDEALKSLPRQPRHRRAPGRRRSQQHRLAARSLGVVRTGSATCWWRRASSTRRSRAYRDSLAIAERLAAADRSNTGWQRDLSVSYDRIGDVLVAQGKLDEALKSLPRQPRHLRAPGRRRSQQRRVAARSLGVVPQGRRRADGAGQARRGAQEPTATASPSASAWPPPIRQHRLAARSLGVPRQDRRRAGGAGQAR